MGAGELGCMGAGELGSGSGERCSGVGERGSRGAGEFGSGGTGVREADVSTIDCVAAGAEKKAAGALQARMRKARSNGAKSQQILV